jgi:hypothetical protein
MKPWRDDRVVEAIAKAIYDTHWKPPSPIWDSTSETVRAWVKAQAVEALRAAERLNVKFDPNEE